MNILLGRIAICSIRYCLPLPLSVCVFDCLSVRLSFTSVCAAKPAERIEMPFGMPTRGGPRNHYARWGPRYIPRGMYPWAIGVISTHAQTYPRSIFSTLFASEQQRWPLVYCNNLYRSLVAHRKLESVAQRSHFKLQSPRSHRFWHSMAADEA